MRRLMPLMLLVLACNGQDPTDETDTTVAPDPYDVEIGPYEATVRTTSYGIPHITAADDGSIGFGLGQVWAKNHGCTIADQILKTRSERSEFFGEAHLDSDFGWKHLRVRQHAEETWFDYDEKIRARIVGMAAGYNAYLEANGSEGFAPACAGQPWVRPISHIDLLAYYYSIIQWGSGYNLVTLVGQARPPNAEDQNGEILPPLVPPPMDILEPVKHPPIGSNGWAIGSDMSSTDGGMLLSNTHFPMTGERQWMEMHLTIPGELDVYGVGLVGFPIVAMGFNKDIAWTHTVSGTPRFLPYLLDMENDRVSYTYNGEREALTPTTYTVKVLRDGSVEEVQRTLYDSRYGPMWNAPVVGWGALGMSYRDVNWKNTGTIANFDGMNRATDLESFKAAHANNQGIPWVHTMATDKEGNALYMDSSVAPNISGETWSAVDEFVGGSFIAQQFANFGLDVLDGGDPRMAWTEDPDAVRPGAVPFDDVPQLTRRDYVMNANQNHWLTNPDAPLTGYNRIFGPEDVPASTRSRMNHFYLQGLGANPEIGDDGIFTLDELETASMSMRSSVSELLKDDIVARCQAHTGTIELEVDGAAESVDIGPACDVLAAWDGRGGTESVGAHIWREMMGSGPLLPGDLVDQGKLFAEPFDPRDPIATPRGLAPAGERDVVLDALATATVRIGRAGFELDDALGTVQVRKMGTESIPTPGGYYFEGYIGIATWSGRGGDTTLLPPITRGTVVNEETDLTDEGYIITNGNSWMMALQYGPDGPEARAVMTYSQSANPNSPWFSDQTELYATQRMRPILFEEADIAADPNLTTETFTLE